MRRSTSLMAQLVAQSREGTELYFDGSAGGYFSVDPQYALKVMGKTEQIETKGKNLFPLGDLLNMSDWPYAYGDGIMDSGRVMTMLEPLTAYTVSFDAECVGVPDASIECDNELCVAEGFDEHSLEVSHMGLGFVLVPPDAIEADYGLGLPYANGSPLVNMFVEHRIGVGEKYHGVVSFVTPDSLEGYTLHALTNQYFYSHNFGPQIDYPTINFTSIQIERGSEATSYEPYSGGVPTSVIGCVKAGSVIVCGENRATVPCDLYDGDVWYPMTGIVDRGDNMSAFTPQPLIAPIGSFSITQEPLELKARLSATLLTKKADGGLSWKEIQGIVRCGLAGQYFKIGDRLTCKRGEDTLVWDVIGIDHDIPTDKSLKHSLTLQLHDCFTSLRYEAVEALFYAEEELPAGTYNFTLLEGYETGYGGGKTYHFTLSMPVPAGGVIMFPWGFQKQAADTVISTYGSVTSTTVIESVSVTEGSMGTALESIGECNFTQYIRFGSNNWLNSDMRQYLNSNAAAGGVWTPGANFDRPPEWVENTDGFLYGLDEDFVAVIGEVDKITLDGSTCYAETNTERIFLLSRSEVYGGNEGGFLEGNAYPYYADNSDLSSPGVASDSNRIKYKNGAAQYWWLRSPNYSNISNIRRATITGEINSTSAAAAGGVAPACCII